MRIHRRLSLLATGVVAAAVGILVASGGLGAQSVNQVQAAAATAQALSPLAALVPLGVSPFLALGLFGALSSLSSFTVPPALGFLSYSVIWVGLLMMAVVLHAGRSFKLTKPLVEIAGTAESLVAFVAMGALLVAPGAQAAPEGTGVAEASLFGAVLLTIAAMTGLVALIVIRMAIDFLTWLSPIPMIDALLQLVKLGLTALLVVAAVFIPSLAIGMNVALLIAMLVVARWVFRASRFMLAVLVDRVLGALSPLTLKTGYGFVEPATAWIVSSRCDLRRFERVPVRWTAGAGWMAGPVGNGTDFRHLGGSDETTLAGGILGTTLVTPQANVLVTARYRDAGRVLASASGTRIVPSRFSGGPAIQVRTI